jgi:hypothetical protein
MSRPSGLALTFAIAFAVLLISPPFLDRPFGPYPLMRAGSVTDILTPLILIPLYWLLFVAAAVERPSQREVLAFGVLAALWAEGHGMHLAANSVDYLLDGDRVSPHAVLTYFYDESLGHYLWHIAVAGLVALVFWRALRARPSDGPIPMWPLLAAAAIYGFAFFAITVEAQTAPLGVGFAVLLGGTGCTPGCRGIRGKPLLLFIVVAHLVAVAFFVFWAAWWSGLPEFSDPRVGIID